MWPWAQSCGCFAGRGYKGERSMRQQTLNADSSGLWEEMSSGPLCIAICQLCTGHLFSQLAKRAANHLVQMLMHTMD